MLAPILRRNSASAASEKMEAPPFRRVERGLRAASDEFPVDPRWVKITALPTAWEFGLFFFKQYRGRSPPTINLIGLGYKNTPGISGGRYMRWFRRSSGGVTWEKQRHSDWATLSIVGQMVRLSCIYSSKHPYLCRYEWAHQVSRSRFGRKPRRSYISIDAKGSGGRYQGGRHREGGCWHQCPMDVAR